MSSTKCVAHFRVRVTMFFRKSGEQEKVRSISHQEALSRPSQTQQLSEAAKAANRTEIISPANEQYENRSKLLRYHYKQEPLRKQRSGIQAKHKRQHRIQRKQRSGIQAEYKRQHRVQQSGESSESGSLEYSEAAKRNTRGSS